MELCGEILPTSHARDIHAVLHLYNEVIAVVNVERAIVLCMSNLTYAI